MIHFAFSCYDRTAAHVCVIVNCEDRIHREMHHNGEVLPSSLVSVVEKLSLMSCTM